MASYNLTAELQIQNVVGIRQAVAQVETAFKNAKIDVSVNVSGTSLRSLEELNSRITSIQNNLRGLVASSVTASSAVSNIGAGARSNLDALNTSIQRANGSFGSIGTGAAQASKHVEGLADNIALTARRFVAFSVAAGGIVAAFRGIRAGIEDALEFERAMVRLAQVSGETPPQIRAIETEVTRLSTSLGVSSRELVNQAIVLKQAGLSALETKQALEAIGRASLAPNFGNMKEITEGAISVIRQFDKDVGNLSTHLGAMNEVAGGFAVEASDLVEVTRRAGGAFQQAGGNLNELLGLFTSVRSTTRESAESIATGLRTIFSRLQRPETIEVLKQFQIELRHTSEEASRLGDTNLTGQFVGASEAIRRISEGLAGLRTTDTRYTGILDQLGGYRQISRVIPLIQQQGEAQRAMNVAQAGSISLQIASERAQDSLLVKTQSVKEEYLALFRAITESNGFQALAKSALTVASGFEKVLEFVKPLVPLMLTLAGVKLFQSIPTAYSAITNRAFYNDAPKKMARGGVVTGGSPNVDSVHTLLMPGEVVIPQDRAQQVGYGNLQRLIDGRNQPNRQRFAFAGDAKTVAGTVLTASANIDELYPKDQRLVILGRDLWPVVPVLREHFGRKNTQYFVWSRPQGNAYVKHGNGNREGDGRLDWDGSNRVDRQTAKQWIKEVHPDSAVLDTGYAGSIFNAIRLIDKTIPKENFRLFNSKKQYGQIPSDIDREKILNHFEYLEKLTKRGKSYSKAGNLIYNVNDESDSGARENDVITHLRSTETFLQYLGLNNNQVDKYSSFTGATPAERLGLTGSAIERHFQDVAIAREQPDRKKYWFFDNENPYLNKAAPFTGLLHPNRYNKNLVVRPKPVEDDSGVTGTQLFIGDTPVSGFFKSNQNDLLKAKADAVGAYIYSFRSQTQIKREQALNLRKLFRLGFDENKSSGFSLFRNDRRFGKPEGLPDIVQGNGIIGTLPSDYGFLRESSNILKDDETIKRFVSVKKKQLESSLPKSQEFSSFPHHNLYYSSYEPSLVRGKSGNIGFQYFTGLSDVKPIPLSPFFENPEESDKIGYNVRDHYSDLLSKRRQKYDTKDLLKSQFFIRGDDETETAMAHDYSSPTGYSEASYDKLPDFYKATLKNKTVFQKYLEVAKRKNFIPYEVEALISGFATGGLVRLSARQAISQDDIVSQVLSRSNRQSYANLLLDGLADTDAHRFIPKDSKFLGHGISAIAFKSPKNEVFRVQPYLNQRPFSFEPQRSSSVFSYRRPENDAILQALGSDITGSTLTEKLPFVPSIQSLLGEKNPYKLTEYMPEIQKILQRQLRAGGLFYPDMHTGNVGILNGKPKIIDPGSIMGRLEAAKRKLGYSVGNSDVSLIDMMLNDNSTGVKGRDVGELNLTTANFRKRIGFDKGGKSELFKTYVSSVYDKIGKDYNLDLSRAISGIHTEDLEKIQQQEFKVQPGVELNKILMAFGKQNKKLYISTSRNNVEDKNFGYNISHELGHGLDYANPEQRSRIVEKHIFDVLRLHEQSSQRIQDYVSLPEEVVADAYAGLFTSLNRKSFGLINANPKTREFLYYDSLPKLRDKIGEYNGPIKFAKGGWVVPGTGNTDSFPADLSPGSYVIRKKSAERIGHRNLAAMAQGGQAQSVPALLMPGEFVFGPDDAARIGAARLHSMNVNGYANGGRVRLAGGADPGTPGTREVKFTPIGTDNFRIGDAPNAKKIVDGQFPRIEHPELYNEIEHLIGLTGPRIKIQMAKIKSVIIALNEQGKYVFKEFGDLKQAQGVDGELIKVDKSQYSKNPDLQNIKAPKLVAKAEKFYKENPSLSAIKDILIQQAQFEYDFQVLERYSATSAQEYKDRAVVQAGAQFDFKKAKPLKGESLEQANERTFISFMRGAIIDQIGKNAERTAKSVDLGKVPRELPTGTFGIDRSIVDTASSSKPVSKNEVRSQQEQLDEQVETNILVKSYEKNIDKVAKLGDAKEVLRRVRIAKLAKSQGISLEEATLKFNADLKAKSIVSPPPKKSEEADVVTAAHGGLTYGIVGSSNKPPAPPTFVYTTYPGDGDEGKSNRSKTKIANGADTQVKQEAITKAVLGTVTRTSPPAGFTEFDLGHLVPGANTQFDVSHLVDEQERLSALNSSPTPSPAKLVSRKPKKNTTLTDLISDQKLYFDSAFNEDGHPFFSTGKVSEAKVIAASTPPVVSEPVPPKARQRKLSEDDEVRKGVIQAFKDGKSIIDVTNDIPSEFKGKNLAATLKKLFDKYSPLKQYPYAEAIEDEPGVSPQKSNKTGIQPPPPPLQDIKNYNPVTGGQKTSIRRGKNTDIDIDELAFGIYKEGDDKKVTQLAPSGAEAKKTQLIGGRKTIFRDPFESFNENKDSGKPDPKYQNGPFPQLYGPTKKPEKDGLVVNDFHPSISTAAGFNPDAPSLYELGVSAPKRESGFIESVQSDILVRRLSEHARQQRISQGELEKVNLENEAAKAREELEAIRRIPQEKLHEKFAEERIQREARQKKFEKDNGTVTLPELIRGRANLRAAELIKERGGEDVLSDTTKNKLKLRAAEEEAVKVKREFISGETKAIQANNKLISSVEARQQAEDNYTRALNENRLVIISQANRNVNKTGNDILATADTLGNLQASRKAITPTGNFFTNAIEWINNKYTSAKEKVFGVNPNQNPNEGISQVGGFALLGLPYLAEGISKLGGEADVAAKSGQTGTFWGGGFGAARGTSGGIQGGIIGTVIGGAAAGSVNSILATTAAAPIAPWITAIATVSGALIGGVSGLVGALRDAKKEIQDVKVNEALSIFADRVTVLSNLGSQANGSVRVEALSRLQTIRNESNSRIRNQIDGTFFAGDRIAYQTTADRNLRQDFGGQLAGMTQYLSKEAEEIGKNNVGRSINDLEQILREGGGGLNREFIQLIADIRNVSKGSVIADLRKSIEAGQRQEQVRIDARAASRADSNLANFGRVTIATQAAVDSAGLSRTLFRAASDQFSGGLNPVAVHFGADRLQNIGRYDITGGLEDTLGLVRRSFGTQGNNADRIIRTANNVSRVLPDVLIQARGQGAIGETTGDFVSRVRTLLTNQLGGAENVRNNEQLGHAINNVIHGLNELTNHGLRDLDNALQTDSSALSENLLSRFTQPLQRIQQALQTFEGQQNQFISGLSVVNQRIDQARDYSNRGVTAGILQLRSQAEFTDYNRFATPNSTLRDIPIERLNADVQNRLEQLSGRTGDDARNPQLIGRLLAEARREETRLITRQQRVIYQNGNVTETAEQLNTVRFSIQNYIRALEAMTDSTRANAAIQERLNDISQERQGRLNYASNFAVSNPEQRLELNQGVYALIRAHAQGNFEGFTDTDIRRAVETGRHFQNVSLPALGGDSGGTIINNLLRNTPGLAPLINGPQDEAAEVRRLQQEASRNFAASAEAYRTLSTQTNDSVQTLISFLRTQQTQFFEQLNAQLARGDEARLNARRDSLNLDRTRIDSQVASRDTLRSIGITSNAQYDTANSSTVRAAITSYFDSDALYRGQVETRDRLLQRNQVLPDGSVVNRGFRLADFSGVVGSNIAAYRGRFTTPTGGNFDNDVLGGENGILQRLLSRDEFGGPNGLNREQRSRITERTIRFANNDFGATNQLFQQFTRGTATNESLQTLIRPFFEQAVREELSDVTPRPGTTPNRLQEISANRQRAASLLRDSNINFQNLTPENRRAVENALQAFNGAGNDLEGLTDRLTRVNNELTGIADELANVRLRIANFGGNGNIGQQLSTLPVSPVSIRRVANIGVSNLAASSSVTSGIDYLNRNGITDAFWQGYAGLGDGFANGGLVGGYAYGGRVGSSPIGFSNIPNPVIFSPSGTDTVPAMLANGSFVVRRSVAEQHRSFLDSLVSGFSGGGMVPAMLTPGEHIIPPHVARNNIETLHALNNGGVARLADGGIPQPRGNENANEALLFLERERLRRENDINNPNFNEIQIRRLRDRNVVGNPNRAEEQAEAARRRRAAINAVNRGVPPLPGFDLNAQLERERAERERQVNEINPPEFQIPEGVPFANRRDADILGLNGPEAMAAARERLNAQRERDRLAQNERNAFNRQAQSDPFSPAAALQARREFGELGVERNLIGGQISGLRDRQLEAQTVNPFARFGLARADSQTQTSVNLNTLQTGQRLNDQFKNKSFILELARSQREQNNRRQWEALGTGIQNALGFGPRRAALGGFIHGFADGGHVPGNPFGPEDTNLIRVSGGEYVLPRRAVQNLGVNNLDRVRRYAEGGQVGNALPSLNSLSLNNVSGSNGANAQVMQQLSASMSGFSSSSLQLLSAFSNFGQSVQTFAKALEGFPNKLTITGHQTHEVIFNGAEVFSSMQGEIKELIEEKAKEVVRDIFKSNLPQLGVNLD